jgi:phage gp29-like protein
MGSVIASVNGQDIKGKQSDIATRKRVGEHRINFDILPNIDPILRKCNRRNEVYEQVNSDTRVRAAVRQRKAKITGMEWGFKGGNTPEDQIKVLTDLYESYNMRETISQVLNASGFGYQVFEINWGRAGDLILPVELIAKPNHWFAYNQDNELVLKTNNLKTEPLPQEKFIVARNNPTYDNPYGEGYLSSCFWPVTFRKNGWAAWSIFMEKYGMPLAVLTGKEGTKQDEIDEAAEAVAEAVLDGVISLPSNFELEMHEAAKGKESVHSQYIDYANTDIAIAVLGTNLTMEIKGGSLAASGTSKEVTEDQVESDEKLTEEFFNELTGRIYNFNWNQEQCPQLDLFEEKDVSKERSERDKNLLESNPNLKLTEVYYERNYKLKKDEFAIINTTGNEG